MMSLPFSVARFWPTDDMVLYVMREPFFHPYRESAVSVHLGEVVGEIDIASD